MPAAPRDWAGPFLDQAREDLRAAYAITASACPATLCMLLQMVFEKLAKAVYARSGLVVARTHRAASHLFAVLRRHPAGKSILLASPNVEQFVMELEAAHPAEAGRHSPPWPQLEYPWEDQSGAVLCPGRDRHLARRVQDPKDRIALDALKFASAVARDLTVLVP